MLAYSGFRDLFLSRLQIVFVTSAWSSFETTLPILGGADESIEETVKDICDLHVLDRVSYGVLIVSRIVLGFYHHLLTVSHLFNLSFDF